MEERAWYVVQTYSGLEENVKNNLLKRAESMNMQDVIFNVLVPELTEYEKKKNGDVKEIKVHPYSSYVFVEMIYTPESWFMIRNTPMVTGFLGSSGGGAKPVPLQEEEIAPILKMCGISRVKEFNGKVGDKAKIIAGNWVDTEGVISAIDMTKGTVTIEIELLGRKNEFEVEFNEVKVL